MRHLHLFVRHKTLSPIEVIPCIFLNFASSLFQVSVMTDVLLNYGWKYVAFLYSDDTYGKNAEAEFSMQAELNDICIGYTRSISVTSDESVYNSTVRDLLELKHNSLVSVVILFIQREMATSFFEHARTGGIERDFIFIGSDGWGNYDLDPVRGSEEAALGKYVKMRYEFRIYTKFGRGVAL